MRKRLPRASIARSVMGQSRESVYGAWACARAVAATVNIAGDFNGNHTSDALWRNTNTGEVDTWLMSNGHLSGGSAIGYVSSAWQTR